MGKEKKKQDRKRQERKKPSVFRQIKLGLQDPITLICMGIVFLILVACVVYIAALLLLRAISKDDVLMLPKGQKIAKVLEKHNFIM